MVEFDQEARVASLHFVNPHLCTIGSFPRLTKLSVMCLARWQIFSFDLDEPFQLKRHVASPFLSGTIISWPS